MCANIYTWRLDNFECIKCTRIIQSSADAGLGVPQASELRVHVRDHAWMPEKMSKILCLLHLKEQNQTLKV